MHRLQLRLDVLVRTDPLVTLPRQDVLRLVLSRLCRIVLSLLLLVSFIQFQEDFDQVSDELRRSTLALQLGHVLIESLDLALQELVALLKFLRGVRIFETR